MAEAQRVVHIDRVTKRFGAMTAVDDITLEIGQGEFFSILGPSGCGKTTTLRMLAGFERPDAGEIWLDGQPVANVPPYRRNVNTVFQSYALFEHLNVSDNIAYGLRRRRVPKADIQRRVADVLELVRLSSRSKALPRELSGGQQQRVALARALVNVPSVLLLDEPLGALDLELRRKMQIELKQIQREVGVTFVFVTHDQEEALTMSDRIAVMDGGVVKQVGTPTDVYEDPQSLFVAQFLGISNVLNGTVTADGVQLVAGAHVTLPSRSTLPVGGAATLAIRPEKIDIDAATVGSTSVELQGKISNIVYLGSVTQVTVATGPGEVTVMDRNSGNASIQSKCVGDDVTLSFAPNDVRCFGEEPPAVASDGGV